MMHSIVSQHEELSIPIVNIGVVEKPPLKIILFPILTENFEINLDLEICILVNKFYFCKYIYLK